MTYQQTLSTPVSFKGIGLHTGERAQVLVKPAEENTGVIFRRVDRGGDEAIRADLSNIRNVNFSITLGSNGRTVKTVEHLLAALAGLKIDNAVVEIDGPEIPGMDGSAWPFVQMFRKAGVREQSIPKQYIKIKKPIEVSIDGKFAMILPHPGQKISYTISFDHPVLRRQHLSFSLNEAYFAEHIASARTFGFLKDAEELKRRGLAKGVSLDNSVVIGETSILNNKLRYHDEFVRHKVLDFIGDLSLVGHPIIGHLIAFRSGHSVNILLGSKIQEHRDSWDIVNGHEVESSQPYRKDTLEHIFAGKA